MTVAAHATAPTPPRSPRLVALLEVRREAIARHELATDEALDEARTLGPELAGAVVAAVLDAYAGDDRQQRRVAERAADVAGALRLTGAVPALARCIERLSNYDSAAHAALRALERMRPEATAPLLEVFRRCPDAESRAIVASALVEACVRDGRVRKALCGMLEEDPLTAAECLRAHGDRDAIPVLAATLDQLALLPHGDPGERHRCDAIVALGQAIHGLGGRISKGQAAKFDAAWERGGVLLLEDDPEPPGDVRTS